jgi:copper chaperone CopZ
MKEVFLVENIKCHGCAGTITTELKKLVDDFSVIVTPEEGRVEVSSEHTIDRHLVLDKLSQLGYPEVGDNNLISKAKSYVSCVIGRIHSEPDTN